MGLMQLMPATWSAISLRERLGQDPFDLRANVLAGAAYLRSMIDRFGDLSSALAAYNAGPGRVDDWRLHGHVLPAETLAYVTRLSRQLGLGAPDLRGSAPLGGRARAADWRAASLFRPTRREEYTAPDHGPDNRSPPAVMRSDQSDLPALPGLFVAVSQRSEP
jgi:soluble lytic murein transglycosylase-like protein